MGKLRAEQEMSSIMLEAQPERRKSIKRQSTLLNTSAIRHQSSGLSKRKTRRKTIFIEKGNGSGIVNLNSNGPPQTGLIKDEKPLQKASNQSVDPTRKLRKTLT